MDVKPMMMMMNIIYCCYCIIRSYTVPMNYVFLYCESSLKQRHGNRRRVYELPLPSVELNLTKANFIRAGACSLRTTNSPCLVCLFTLLDASIDRHFASFVQF